ncbi:MAG: VPLPA-CTERM sorting domain-containing protein [Thermodesulfobacteriota bacterium]|nr:VPLPA-CTERM sorting domain-containing protein [Thermodesulfobacteriota bacterium]
MKKFGGLIFSLVLACAVVFSASSAFAYASADSDAWLGAVTITGGTIIGTPTYLTSALALNNLGESDSDSGTTAYASVTRAIGDAGQTSGDPYESTWAYADGNGDSAEAMAKSEVSYWLDVTGTLNVSQSWGFSQTLEATQVADFAYAYSEASFSIYYAGGWHDYYASVTNWIYNPDSLLDSGTDTLSFQILDLEPGEYEVKAGVYNAAQVDTVGNQVPVPAAIWLLGSGLIGLVGFRKKIKN